MIADRRFLNLSPNLETFKKPRNRFQGRLRKGQLADGRSGGEGVGGEAKSYDDDKALSSINHSILSGSIYVPSEFKEKYGVWVPVLELTQTSPYLRVESKVSFSPSVIMNYNGKGVGWGRPLLLVGHIGLCSYCLLIFIAGLFFKN